MSNFSVIFLSIACLMNSLSCLMLLNLFCKKDKKDKK